MSSAAERLNNAIYKLEWHTPSEPKGRKAAVVQLADHWGQWWDSTARKALPPAAQAGKLKRYAEWYARAWWLVGAETRAKVADPRSLDVTWEAAVADQLSQLSEGAAATVKAGGDVASYVGDAAKALKREIRQVQVEARNALLLVGAVAVAVLLAFAHAKK